MHSAKATTLADKLKNTLLLGWALCYACAIVLAFTPLDMLPWLGTLLAPLEQHIKLERAVYSPLAYMTLFSLVVWFETHRPVQDQPLLTPSLALDTSYYLTKTLSQASLIGAWIVLVKGFYDQYLSFLTIQAVGSWHPAISFSTQQARRLNCSGW